ncbi:amphiphysin [Starmerella bacillaris]|uniref:Amphiphysin n=1 Tax=Starmerella bacillaris TaxID=1247836 RepID=A0AAV5RDT0_STABA|nr:amphiphysin [Starmerella bacillaris]
MSWKGFQKGVVRAPQVLKNNIGSHNEYKDPIIEDAESRFTSMENLTKRLHSESKRFWQSITDMLNHQLEFVKNIEQVYRPITGRPGGDAGDEDGHVEGINACEQYRNQLLQIQELIRPEHEMIETRILRPVDELLSLIKKSQKMFVKREHKLLDLERQTEALHKLQDKTERNPKQEEKLNKVENDYEMAKEQFSYYDELIKNELPKLFKLESEVIEPMFQSFYFMQLNIYYTMHTHMAESKIPYMDMETDIIESFMKKQGTTRQEVESIPIVQFNTNATSSFGAYPSGSRVSSGSKMSGDRFNDRSSTSSSTSAERPERERSDDNPPTYEQSNQLEGADAPPLPSRMGAVKSEKPKDEGTTPPPPPPRKPERHSAPSTCTALYDYEANNANELAIHKGDVIEILERGDSRDDWWLGRVNGKEGFFPGSYVDTN